MSKKNEVAGLMGKRLEKTELMKEQRIFKAINLNAQNRKLEVKTMILIFIDNKKLIYERSARKDDVKFCLDVSDEETLE